ncbi:hypothetical protein QSV34_14270 [Porticoccus sp. W117]|uniref:hypothetical protein n=1 Tax=Porticoccus sp. W117 TaxID=3054777 RepID=UPI002591F6AA|nr:hypothetical protein [Porticoccus sp. W117]MDM3872514.1 hypothetical protein [Porticoccus sp. W117]
MREQKFEYGPISRGCYVALLWLTVFFAFTDPKKLPAHIGVLLFLGLGLRPLLECTGLCDLWQQFRGAVNDRRYRKISQKKRVEVERKDRNKRYKRARFKDPRLPKNW